MIVRSRLARNFSARKFLASGLLAAALLAGPHAWAVNPDEVLPDAAMEARARALSTELRCLVCQNQSIDDSDAPLARDLRLIVREKIKAGDSDGAIKTFLVDRYGEFVLLKPSFSARTALLWAGPFAVLLGGVAVVWINGRRRRAEVETLSTEEEAAIRSLLDKTPAGGVSTAASPPTGSRS